MKKKVLFVIESLSGGGAEKVLTTIVKNIDKTKFDITVLTIVKTGIYVEEIEKYCTLISMLPEYEKLTNPIAKMKYKVDYKKIYKEDCAKIYKKYVKNVYDVEIAFVEGFVTKLVANSTNKYSKKYAWIHTDMIKNNHADDNYSNFEEHKKIYSKFDTIFAVSEYVKEVFIEKFGNEFKEKTKIQYNPVDSQEIEKLAQKPINDQYEKQVKFIAIGRFVEAKGFDRLVFSAYKLHKEGYEFEVWILGQGEEKNDIGQYIKENQMQDYFKLKGFQENPYPYIQAADALICSSRAEGFSTVATEALILNKPIFTTDCSGMRELFGEYQCGIICENSENGIYDMLHNVLEQADFSPYIDHCKIRAKDFTIRKRMSEIEGILNA